MNSEVVCLWEYVERRELNLIMFAGKTGTWIILVFAGRFSLKLDIAS